VYTIDVITLVYTIDVITIAPLSVQMTDLGWKIAGLSRQHRAEGGRYANFDLAAIKG